MFVCPKCGFSADSAGFCTEDGTVLVYESDPLIGTLVGSYRITKVAGRGGMGVVYLAVQPSIGSRVALKVLSVSHAESPVLVERFFAEARAVNVIRHEAIVNVLDLALLPDGRPYIVMEFLEGAPLSGHISERGALPLGTFTTLAVEALDALSAAHQHGIVHRDLKPDNVFVTSRGRVKLLDFGIAKLKPELGAGDVATRTGSLLGTPQYMSPEQARGLPADARSDVYSFGVVLYEAVTGSRPFEADSLFEILRHHIEVRPEPPTRLAPTLPPAYEQVILRALEKDPALRFQSAAELAHALQEVARYLPEQSYEPLSIHPSSAEPVRPTPRASFTPPTAPGTFVTTAPASKSRLPLILGAALALALVLVLGLVVVGAFGIGLWSGTRGSAASASATTTSTGSTMRMYSDTVDGDVRHFDPVARIEYAQKLAAKFIPDAELAVISVVEPRENGTVDLGSNTATVSYTFRSKERIQAPCMVSVSAVAGSVYVTELATGPCTLGAAGKPSCSVGQVLEKAALPATGKTTATFAATPAGGSWSVARGQGNKVVPDDCGAM